MKDTSSLLTRLGGLGFAAAVRTWMSTLDYRVAYYDQDVDPMYGTEQPRIYVFWHEYILLPLYLRGNCDLVMLLSRHRDADILSRTALHMGFECVRGSTFRGSTAALRELARHGRSRHLTITPDGPRGPRRRLAQGPIYLASMLGLPVVPLGFAYDRPWRMNSWDQFAVPRPFSRARAVVGPAIQVAPDLDREQIEQRRERMEQLLTDLTVAAEQWADSGCRMGGEVATTRRSRVLGKALPAPPADLKLFPPLQEATADESLSRRQAG